MDSPAMASQGRNEIFTVKKSYDPAGTGLVGAAPGFNLQNSASARPIILYEGRHGRFFLQGELYKIDGAPMYLNLYCPVCQNSIRIGQDNKQMQHDPERTPRFRGFHAVEILSGLEASDFGGCISIEPFRCSWEVAPDLRRDFGFAVCPWAVAVDDNIAKDV